MRSIIRCVLFTVLTFSAAIPSAANYLCSVQYLPGSSSLGSYGGMLVTINSVPNCGGTNVKNGNLCSSGATNSACSNPASSRFTSADQTATYFSTLVQAVEEDDLVGYATSACIGGGSGCLLLIQFIAD